MTAPMSSAVALRDPGLSTWTTVAVSTAAHVVLVAAVLLWWLPNRTTDAEPRDVMRVSLGGAPGPRAGGLTPMAAPAAPAPPTPRPAPPPPPTPAPAAVPAKPVPVAPPRPTPQTRPRQQPAPEPTASEEPADAGTAPVLTGARGQGFGLSSGGGGGSSVELDVGNFCCPEYIAQMVTLIQRNWQQGHGVTGVTTMVFTIRRDGTLDAIAVERSSRFLALDNAADRALRLTRQLPALPAQFPNPTLTVHMKFEYTR